MSSPRHVTRSLRSTCTQLHDARTQIARRATNTPGQLPAPLRNPRHCTHSAYSLSPPHSVGSHGSSDASARWSAFVNSELRVLGSRSTLMLHTPLSRLHRSPTSLSLLHALLHALPRERCSWPPSFSSTPSCHADVGAVQLCGGKPRLLGGRTTVGVGSREPTPVAPLKELSRFETALAAAAATAVSMRAPLPLVRATR